MNKIPNNTGSRPLPKKQPRWLVTVVLPVGIILGGLLTWFLIAQPYKQEVYPLGDGLEYVGKEDAQCAFSTCNDILPSSYYYTTDMTIDEVTKYFSVDQPGEINYPNDNGAYSYRKIKFKTPQGTSFEVTYVQDGNKVTIAKKPIRSDKPYVVIVYSDSYSLAKGFLKNN